jgi:hypothetical protein
MRERSAQQPSSGFVATGGLLADLLSHAGMNTLIVNRRRQHSHRLGAAEAAAYFAEAGRRSLFA